MNESIFALQRATSTLQRSTAALEQRVAALERYNQLLRSQQQSYSGDVIAAAAQQKQADEKLNVDIQAARGVKPAYKSDVSFAIEARKFILGILSSEMYGHAVSREVRNAARRVLGIDSTE